jgi:pseudaminic acid biosynthesis-associated methylase
VTRRLIRVPTPQEDFWSNSFGDQYLQRNRVDWRLRVPFWRKIVALTQSKSVLEVGCSAGWNMRALHTISPALCLCGCDVNASAVKEARAAGLNAVEASLFDIARVWPGGFDLTFTAGVLIHVSSDDIHRAMTEIVSASHRYVLAVEYAADKEEEVSYRGHAERLWRRPFGKMYEQMGLRLIDSGLLLPEHGFDTTTYWLMQRT